MGRYKGQDNSGVGDSGGLATLLLAGSCTGAPGLAVWHRLRLVLDVRGVEAGGTLTITSNFYVASTGIMTIYGQMTIQAGAYTDFFDYANLTLEVGGTIQTYSTFYIEWSSQATIRDDLSVENGGYLYLYDNYTVLTIESNGAVKARARSARSAKAFAASQG